MGMQGIGGFGNLFSGGRGCGASGGIGQMMKKLLPMLLPMLLPLLGQMFGGGGGCASNGAGPLQLTKMFGGGIMG